MSVPAKLPRLHDSLRAAGLAHAFGGALALAWCTERARGTIDIDVNVFVSIDHVDDVLDGMPNEVTWSADDRKQLRRDGQVRLWWDETPIDVFLDTTEFHQKVGGRIRWERFGEHRLPFLSCRDLAVFKAFFDRTRDWADLEEMHAAGCLDGPGVIAVLIDYLGVDDRRIERLQQLTRSEPTT